MVVTRVPTERRTTPGDSEHPALQARIMDMLVIGLAVGLWIVGFALGYGLRAWISYRRRLAAMRERKIY
jgi:hypothetical protein